MSTADDDELITPEGLEALKAELAELEGPRRAELSKRIQAAREEGDLKENAEYHAAKEEQSHMETKILRLQERLRKAKVTEADGASGKVAFGVPVTVTDVDAGREQSFTIVGPTEADPGSGKISSESPVAQALLGASPGQTVEVDSPGGKRSWRVEKVG
ncbi:MAG: transcription elongation factor GreA [Solirubrobacteraceae bacterium]|nr:transcription elongation factor GreA [Solirubrobacteraceae bacterium]